MKNLKRNTCMCKCSGTTNQIVKQLANDKKLMNELKKIHNEEYIEDIIQDIFLQFLEKEDETKLQRLCAENQMKFFIIGILIRQSQSKKTTKNYKQLHSYNLNLDIVEDEYTQFKAIPDGIDWNTEEVSRIVEKELAKLHFYDREIFELVIKEGLTFQELGKKINIKPNNIFYTFNKVRTKLRNKIKKIDLN